MRLHVLGSDFPRPKKLGDDSTDSWANDVSVIGSTAADILSALNHTPQTTLVNSQNRVSTPSSISPTILIFGGLALVGVMILAFKK